MGAEQAIEYKNKSRKLELQAMDNMPIMKKAELSKKLQR